MFSLPKEIGSDDCLVESLRVGSKAGLTCSISLSSARCVLSGMCSPQALYFVVSLRHKNFAQVFDAFADGSYYVMVFSDHGKTSTLLGNLCVRGASSNFGVALSRQAADRCFSGSDFAFFAFADDRA